MAAVGLMALTLAGSAASATKSDWQALPVVRPQMACEALTSMRFDKGDLAALQLEAVATVETPQGPFCKVTGRIGPGAIGFVVYLPEQRWTQRFVQGAQNALPIPRAGANGPALRGELVVAVTDKGEAGRSRDALWNSKNHQKRIDWAYRANHVVALAAKALIRAYYGRPQRYAYFIGCSMGGREVLSAVQRFPRDFDGAVAGAPVVLDALHNAFFPGWEWHANRRADGSIILSKDRLSILHDAAIRNCGARSGVIDGMLQHPGACAFDPKWVICKSDTPEHSGCLTAEEADVASKLYTGPIDASRKLLDAGGFPLGSELTWRLSTAEGPANPATDPGNALVRILAPSDPSEDADAMRRRFAFNADWFARTSKMGPLWNTANTNLRPFAKHSGKLILWIGAADTTVQPASTIAYYKGLQNNLGAASTSRFARLFMLPGVKHCGGGEGADQIDVLSAIMAWTELDRAPAALIAGKGPKRAPEVRATIQPWSDPAESNQFTRPVFAYPLIARYDGHGDPNKASSYRSAPPVAADPALLPPEIARLIGPDNQHFYQVQDGKLQPITHQSLSGHKR